MSWSQLEQIAQLQGAIGAYRQGVRSGIPALDADLQLRRIEGPPVGAHDMVALGADLCLEVPCIARVFDS
jgi:hypothetical protein